MFNYRRQLHTSFYLLWGFFMPANMEVLVIVLLFVGFIANIVIMRYFFKGISDKVTFLVSNYLETDTSIPNPPLPIATGLPFKQYSNGTNSAFRFPVDKPLPNQIDEDINDLEFNEQNLSSLPADIKIEVEGGDIHTPPGFEQAKA